MPNADGADLPQDEEKSETIKTLTVLLDKRKRERSMDGLMELVLPNALRLFEILRSFYAHAALALVNYIN